MKMKPEQTMGSAFALLGLAMGYLSVSLGAGTLSFAVPLAVYAGSAFGASKAFGSKKPKWILTNSAITFFLVWIISWIFLFNTL